MVDLWLLGDTTTTNRPVSFDYCCDFIDIFDDGPACARSTTPLRQDTDDRREIMTTALETEDKCPDVIPDSRLNNAFTLCNFISKIMVDFHKRILFSDEAHFWLNSYVNKQNCRIWSQANPQVYVETPLHPEKLTVWCALWAGGILLQKR
ncbi:hypothetical protein TNCV_2260341 [Trichonephila clavipes]|nr:hypothetical protein TNCV_2260341 [Trichonephila clavipes]